MRGYLDDPEQTAETIDEDGWLHTGDIGVMDSNGYLDITDRKKDMIITGGFNVYPAEVENSLMNHPEIAQIAIVGAPDERMGEVAVAFVVPAKQTTPTEADLIDWARERIANFKVPRQVIFVENLPTNASGKVLKFELRESINSSKQVD
jgi:acyl-CoA synthetase (AMP-forming)/AMP-acid ligase II